MKRVEILLIEDNEADARLARETLAEGSFAGRLNTVRSGEKALAFLRREGKYSLAPAVDLVLLDLHLPGLDGQEVLAEIKADEALKSIPVIVLTGSFEDDDVFKAYQKRASCYIVKPLKLEELMTAVSAIPSFDFPLALGARA